MLNQESFGFFSFARFLKLVISARQHSTEICNACRYWSVLVVYWHWHYTIEQCYDWDLRFFTVVFVVVFTDILMYFYYVFDHILECASLWMYSFLPYGVRKWCNKTVWYQSIYIVKKKKKKKKEYKFIPCRNKGKLHIIANVKRDVNNKSLSTKHPTVCRIYSIHGIIKLEQNSEWSIRDLFLINREIVLLFCAALYIVLTFQA